LDLPNPNAWYYSFDPQGNLVQRQAEGYTSWPVYDTVLYDAYGIASGDFWTFANQGSPHKDPVGFGGQWGYFTEWETKPNTTADAGTSLLLLSHRYYDPATGRFVNRDPIGYDGGINLYTFAGGNPVNRIDPQGTWETGSYLGDVGQMFLGYWDVGVGIVRAPYDLATFAGTYADDPAAGAAAFASGLYHGYTDAITGTGSLRNQAASIGNIILTAAPAIKKIPSLRGAGAATTVAASNYINLASPQRTIHILYGDATGGGHLWPGQPGKTPFPKGWAGDEIMHHVSDIATDPNLTSVRPDGLTGLFYKSGKPARFNVIGTRKGVKIKVVTEPAGEGIITAHPIK